ncbi:unnamed protein product [Meloidogyne enterolobii]|uniref:Uncharacterized protein n=1 Tax=Meloidogyne enterolobii TaxID=390850 RepID=A0ACB0ZMT2_MELEN
MWHFVKVFLRLNRPQRELSISFEIYLIALSGTIFSFSMCIPNLSLHSFMNFSSFSSISIPLGNPLA